MLAALNPYITASEVAFRQQRITADFAGARARRVRRELARLERNSDGTTSSRRPHFAAVTR